MGERKRRRWVAFEVIEVVEESKLSMLDTVLVWAARRIKNSKTRACVG